ncbi:MAG: Hpt domain-containing protein, partial [Gallintestinimicrobium sp.]
YVLLRLIRFCFFLPAAPCAFRAAHTLKGVCANLGLDRLYEADSELTEKLRGRQTEGSEELYQKVAEVYETTVTVLKELDNF